MLRVFSPERPSWTLREISAALGWDKATTLRFLAKLVELRFLERDEDGRYSYGTFALELWARSVGVSPVRQRVVRAMGTVARRTALTTQAGYLEGDEVVIALSEEGTMLINAAATLGARLPIHATAIGKAILAQLDDDAIASLLPPRLETFTERTIATRKQLLADIRTVRATGTAHAWSELADGLDAVAVVLGPAPFGLPAAIGCAGPSAGAPLRREIVEQALREASAEINVTVA